MAYHRSPEGFHPYFRSFDQECSTEQTNAICKKLASLQLDRLSETGWLRAGEFIAGCLASDDLSSLLHYDPDILDLGDADVSLIRQCLSLFQSRDDIEIGVDREAVARGKFLDAERECRLTNSAFRAWSQGRFQFLPRVEAVFHRAQLKISELLGDVPSVSDLRPRFGPGATTRVPKRNACLAVKLAQAPSCSQILSEHLDEVLPSLFCGGSTEAEFIDVFIDEASLAFVPKNAKTDRAICTEPSLNGMMQMAIGDHLRDLLRKVGINLRDQSRNRRGALYGSLSGFIATLDLSMASDLITTGLVDHLFPDEWAQLFRRYRSTHVRDGANSYELNKISSMGNGFTFPLETIIFWALASACADYARSKRPVIVYGDDILVEVSAVPLLRDVFQACGFRLNSEKSFWTGRFRESCGHDYISGTDVRPVFQKTAITGADIFRLHNFFFRKGRWEEVEYLKSLLEPEICHYGPDGYGDGHLLTSARRVGPTREGRNKGWCGETFLTWTFSVKLLKKEIMDKFFHIRKDEQSEDPRTRYSRGFRASFVARQIATYTAYQEEKFDRNERLLPEARGVNPFRAFVVPGKGPAILTKVYTFEPV